MLGLKPKNIDFQLDNRNIGLTGSPIMMLIHIIGTLTILNPITILFIDTHKNT